MVAWLLRKLLLQLSEYSSPYFFLSIQTRQGTDVNVSSSLAVGVHLSALCIRSQVEIDSLGAIPLSLDAIILLITVYRTIYLRQQTGTTLPLLRTFIQEAGLYYLVVLLLAAANITVLISESGLPLHTSRKLLIRLKSSVPDPAYQVRIFISTLSYLSSLIFVDAGSK